VSRFARFAVHNLAVIESDSREEPVKKLLREWMKE